MANFLNRRGANGGAQNPPAAQQASAPAVNNTQRLANMIKSMRGINSPQGLMQMLGGNPQQMQQMQALMSSGQNPQQLAVTLMQQKGIDPNELMKALNG